ncbi:MAG TPA: glycine betaine ABC transporter substrate-binding protein [Steroidobacteraceae bacterium]|nr:glycine betaine ABC transporter substrate-binding protein [Steroidobacteraceae bacterium]
MKPLACIAFVSFATAADGAAADAPAADPPRLVVASKVFTESVLLGEVAAGLLESAGFEVEHRRELGGTRVLWNALTRAEIDAYPEYTGTILREIFAGEPLLDEQSLPARLTQVGIGITQPLGFNNTYVLGMRAGQARELGIETISDLGRHPALRFGLSSEFMNRADGWIGLKAAYALPHADVRAMHHDLAYRAIASGAVDVIDLYSTDAEIAYYDLVPLADDQGFFPRYEAVMLYRLELPDRAVAALERLEGALDATEMARLNARVKIEREAESDVANAWLADTLAIEARRSAEGPLERISARTLEHLTLVAISLGAAIAIAIPLGILAVLRPAIGRVLLGIAGLLQTIPALALLVFMIPWFGIGAVPAIVALFLYSLLPILRNTHAGLLSIAPDERESAIALGLPTGARLRLIELPLAARSILAGIKTAAVINVGTATLGALIGAGGYGEPILTGIRLDDLGLILEGAVPAALLALAAQGGFELIERRFVRWGQ